MALQIEQENIVTGVESPVEFFRTHSFERKLPDEPEPARNTFCEIEGHGAGGQAAEEHSYPNYMDRDKVQLVAEDIAQDGIGSRPQGGTGALEKNEPAGRDSGRTCERSRDGIETRDELGNEQ